MSESKYDQFSMELAKKLHDLRKSKKLSQQQVADLIGSSRARVSQHEMGITNMPLSLLKEYAKLYNVSVDYLLGMEKEEQDLNSVTSKYRNYEFAREDLENIEKYIKFVISNRKDNKNEK